MTKLSVNLNKIATLRNARGGKKPDLIKFAIDCQSYGADGITVHPRPDERHIKKQDLFDLKHIIKTEFNIEGYPTKDFLNSVININPTILKRDEKELTKLDMTIMIVDFKNSPTGKLDWSKLKVSLSFDGKVPFNALVNPTVNALDDPRPLPEEGISANVTTSIPFLILKY